MDKPKSSVWARLGLFLGKTAGRVILGGVFFVVLTPCASLARLFGKDPLKRRFDPALPSYWIKNDAALSTMKNQY